MFCDKCGNLLVNKKKGGKNVLSCSCGYVSKKEVIIKRGYKKMREVSSNSKTHRPILTEPVI